MDKQMNDKDYIIEEKIGKIIKVEESTEKQINQKQEFSNIKRIACSAIITLGIAASITSTVGAAKLYDLYKDIKIEYEEELLKTFEMLEYNETEMTKFLISIGKTEEESEKVIIKLKEQLNNNQNIIVGKEK